MHQKQGDYSEAMRLFQQAFTTYRQLNDLKGQADVYMEIGHLHQLLNNYEDSWYHYLDAYRLYRRANNGQGDKLGMAAASEELGTLEFYAQMFPQAIQDLEEAHSLYLSLGLSDKANSVEETLKATRKALEERETTSRS